MPAVDGWDWNGARKDEEENRETIDHIDGPRLRGGEFRDGRKGRKERITEGGAEREREDSIMTAQRAEELWIPLYEED